MRLPIPHKSIFQISGLPRVFASVVGVWLYWVILGIIRRYGTMSMTSIQQRCLSSYATENLI